MSTMLGFVANILSNIAFVPQIVRSFRRKKVDDLSIGMFLTLLMTQLCWMGYAIPIHATQLWTSCLIEIFLLLPIFALWLRYRTPALKRRLAATRLKAENNLVTHISPTPQARPAERLGEIVIQTEN